MEFLDPAFELWFRKRFFNESYGCTEETTSENIAINEVSDDEKDESVSVNQANQELPGEELKKKMASVASSKGTPKKQTPDNGENIQDKYTEEKPDRSQLSLF
jgi:hypothetical protein